MRLRLERRPAASGLLSTLTPVFAVVATMIAGGIMFGLLGADPVEPGARARIERERHQWPGA